MLQDTSLNHHRDVPIFGACLALNLPAVVGSAPAFAMSAASSNGHDSLPYDDVAVDRPAQSVNQNSYSPLFVSDGPTPPPERNTLTSYAVIVPPVERPAEYSIYEDNTIEEVLKRAGVRKYLVRFQDRRKFIVSELSFTKFT